MFKPASLSIGKSVAVVGLAAMALSGCMVFGGPRDKALRRTPSFRQGYEDGCTAASAKSSNPRDAQSSLAGEDRVYRRGYATGFNTCHRSTVAPGDVPDPGLGNGVPVPGRS
jgi:hypothetical protein